MKNLKLCLFAALVCAAASAHAIMKATAIVVEPPATFSHDGIKYQSLTVGAELFTGDVMRTGETGRVVVRFTDGSQAALSSNTDVALRRLAPTDDPIVTRLSLWRGALRALVKKLSNRSSFEVETYNTVVAVKGTDFEVGVLLGKDGKPKTEAKCFDTDGAGLAVSGLDRRDIVQVLKGQETSNSKGSPEQATIIRTKELQRALKKYEKLPLQVPPSDAANAGAKATPVALPPAVQAAQAQFDAAARKAEAAAQDLLAAEKSGDTAAQKKAEESVNDLRQAASGLEDELQKAEEKVEQQIQQEQPKGGGQPGASNPPPADAAMNAAIVQELQQLQQTVKEVARDSKLQQQADAAQGNLLLDKDGFRVQLNTLVKITPDGLTIQKIALSKRSDGPNSGQTEFQHIVTFNQAPDDWVQRYKEALNDPLNLSGGSPNYWRTDDVQKTFNPSGDCVCLDTSLSTPQPIGGALFGQQRTEFYQAVAANGTAARGQETFDASGAYLSGDHISVAASDTGSALHLAYNSNGSVAGDTVGTLFTVNVDLPGTSPALDAFSLGNSLYSLATADLGAVGSGAFQLTFQSPAYPNDQISPVLYTSSFVDAFRQGWR